jgi:hypothetical protein
MLYTAVSGQSNISVMILQGLHNIESSKQISVPIQMKKPATMCPRLGAFFSVQFAAWWNKARCYASVFGI